MSGLAIEADETMVSFDIISLFTNVPKSDTLGVAQCCLTEDKSQGERTKLIVDQIIKGIKVCLSVSYFTFQSRLYVQ